MQDRWQHPAQMRPAAAQINTQLAAWMQVTYPKMSNRQATHSLPTRVERRPIRADAPYLDTTETPTVIYTPEKHNNYSHLGLKKAPPDGKI